MNAFELLTIHRNVLEIMSTASIEVGDVKYIEMYKEYRGMMDKGHKMTYIVQYLSDEYGVGESTVYRVIKKFSEDVEI